MKEVYLHYNPNQFGIVTSKQSLSKEQYYKYCKYGTLYINEILADFEMMARLYLQEGKEYLHIRYGESRLDYTDRLKYNKKIGRDLAKSKMRLRPIKITSIIIKKEVTIIYLQTLIGFSVELEYNHNTKKYFIQVPSLY